MLFFFSEFFNPKDKTINYAMARYSTAGMVFALHIPDQSLIPGTLDCPLWTSGVIILENREKSNLWGPEEHKGKQYKTKKQ